VTGNANEQQILSSLRAYSDRASYMVEALRGFFHISKNWTERKPEVLQVKEINTPFAVHLQKINIHLCPNFFHYGE